MEWADSCWGCEVGGCALVELIEGWAGAALPRGALGAEEDSPDWPRDAIAGE